MTLKKLLFILLSISLVFFTACTSDSTTEPTESIDEFALVTAVGDVYLTDYTTASGGVNTTIDAVFTLLTDGDATNDPFIIDLRSAADFTSGHITGAVNIALGDLMAKVQDGTIPSDKRILVVCYTGQNASVATCALNLLGYDAQNLKFGMCGVTTDPNIGGTGKWTSQTASDEYTLNKVDTGAPMVEYDFPKINTGKKTANEIIMEQFANVTAGWGVLFSDVIANPNDYFIANYWGATDYSTIGHIEGAYQFTPNLAFQADQMLKYLPTDKKIAVYCWTGQTSAQVVTYLRILGYDAYSIYYGVNGFAFGELPDGKPKYHAPTGDYSSIIVQ